MIDGKIQAKGENYEIFRAEDKRVRSAILLLKCYQGKLREDLTTQQTLNIGAILAECPGDIGAI